MKVVALAGGVGGAKLVAGLAGILPSADLTVIVNTGDDFSHYGLKICPDLDTVCYTLAGLANPIHGWGRNNETFIVLEELGSLGGETWFKIGDRDLAIHLERTRLTLEGQPLSKICEHLCEKIKVAQRILPMTDDPVRTLVHTRTEGVISFQNYFVKYACQPVVKGFSFAGIESARPAPGVLHSLHQADMIVICPSNPWVSIEPILSVQGIKEVICKKKAVGVSPIIGGKALKGPAAKMFSELGIVPSAVAVAKHYQDLLWGFMIHESDLRLEGEISGCGIIPLTTNIIMNNDPERQRLAKELLAFWEARNSIEEHI